MKQCSKCGEWKTPIVFSKNKKCKDGLSTWCKECVKKYNKQYKKDNKQKIKINKKLYNIKHKNEIIKYRRQYRNRNKDKIKEYNKQYREKYPEVARKSKLKRRSLKANLPFNFTVVDECIALTYFNNCCAICGRSFKDLPNSLHVSFDHWIPLSDKRLDNPGTVPENMIPLCCGVGGCNSLKHARNPEQWVILEYGETFGKSILERIETYFKWVSIRNKTLMWNQILNAKKLQQQFLAAMHYCRFDVYEYEKWEIELFLIHEQLESLMGDWITNAYYESIGRDI